MTIALNVALAVLVVMAIIFLPTVIYWASNRKHSAVVTKSPEQILQDAFAHKQKLDRDAQVEWSKDFYRMAGEDWNGPSREERRAANLATLRRQTVCQHKWAYVHMSGVMQMYCLTCGTKG